MWRRGEERRRGEDLNPGASHEISMGLRRENDKFFQINFVNKQATVHQRSAQNTIPLNELGAVQCCQRGYFLLQPAAPKRNKISLKYLRQSEAGFKIIAKFPAEGDKRPKRDKDLALRTGWPPCKGELQIKWRFKSHLTDQRYLRFESDISKSQSTSQPKRNGHKFIQAKIIKKNFVQNQ